MSHIYLRPQCGICGDAFTANEDRFVALIRTGDSTAYEVTDVSVFPDYGHNVRRLNGRYLCRQPGCPRCAVSPEAAAVHSDCFGLFTRNHVLGDALDRLWILAAWRYPWRGAPNVRLRKRMHVSPSLLEAADEHGMPELRLLPPETVEMIYDYSRLNLFWRYSSVLNIARELNTASLGDIVSIPLCEVSAWERGGEVACTSGLVDLPILRLTMDSRGINKVERLPGNQPLRFWRTDDMAYIIQEESQLRDVVAHFKYGALRLELPGAMRGLQIWDTPTPPPLEQSGLLATDMTSTTQFRTIDISKITGLTFFVCFCQIYAIHAHTPEMPFAQTTFGRLSNRRQQGVSWVHVPLPADDQILALGAQLRQYGGHFVTSQPCFLFRTRLAGDIVIGPHHSSDSRDFVLSQTPPKLLIHNTAELQAISVFGAYSGERRKGVSLRPFDHTGTDEAPFPYANLSTAPLENVARVQVFYDKESTFCRGMLLEYQNGAQRAVGQCRVGIDPVETWLTPLAICFFRTTSFRPGTQVELQAIKVKSTNKSKHSHGEDGWVCCKMRGNLEFWFTGEQCGITVIMDE